MKPKSTLRSFLAMASSTLLTITYASADTYYWDSDNATPGFGSTAGTWAGTTTTSLIAPYGFTTDATGSTAIYTPAAGMDPEITTSVTTTTADTVNITTTGNITVSGTVNAGTVKMPVTIGGNLNGGTINFPAVGTIEGSKANGNIGSAITGAGTSLTIFCNNESLAFYNGGTINCNNGAAKTIIQQGSTPGQGRFGVAEEQNLGPITSTLEFDGGILRIIPHAIPASQLTSFGTRPVNFVNGKNVEFNVNNNALSFTCNKVLNQGAGNLIKSGAGNSVLVLDQTNTYTGTTDIQAGWLSVGASANLGDITAPLSPGKLQITGTSFADFGDRPVAFVAARGVELDIDNAAHTFTLNTVLNANPNAFTKRGIGTLVLNLDNTLFAAASTLTGGGKVVLDYNTNNGTKFSDAHALALTNSDLTLKGGSHGETVVSSTLGAGHSHIARDGGSATINLNALVRSGGGSISLADGTLATTDLANQASGILGGWATIGNDWAIRSGAADSLITALGSYTGALPDTGTGSVTANYTLTGGQTQTGSSALSAYTVKIGGSGVTNNTLALGATTLSIQNATATNLGGILYIGGGTGIYNITADAAKGINTSAAQDLIINTVTGTLNVSAKINVSNGARALLKAGAGTLVLSSAENAYTGATNVNQGTLLVNGNQPLATGTVTVYNKAKLGGTGTIGGNVAVNSGGGLTFDLITPAGSHESLDLVAGKALTFPRPGYYSVAGSGGTSLTITSTGGSPGIGIYTLVTAPGQAQVETATAAGTVTVSGNATVTVTCASFFGTPIVISVPVVATDTADAIATAIRSALAANVDVSAKFDVSGAAASVVLTVKTAFIAANDTTLNIAIANGTSVGVTPAPTSTNTAGGVATPTGSVPSTVILPVGWTANAPYIDGASLKIEITSVGAVSSPEIEVNQGGDIANAGSKGFGTVTLGSNNSLIFTINNTGNADLNLSTSPDYVAVSGANSADFTITSQPTTPIGFSPNPNSTTFTVKFAPLGTLGGARNALLTIANDDSDEGTFTINVSGTAQTKYEAWALGALFYDDANGDGVDNGLAFLLGATDPTSAVTQPTVTESGGNLILSNFLSRNDASRGTATLYVQHSNDLGIDDPWVSVPVDDAGTAGTGVTFSVTTANPNNTVTATISVSEAAAGKLFGRLNASPTP